MFRELPQKAQDVVGRLLWSGKGKVIHWCQGDRSSCSGHQGATEKTWVGGCQDGGRLCPSLTGWHWIWRMEGNLWLIFLGEDPSSSWEGGSKIPREHVLKKQTKIWEERRIFQLLTAPPAKLWTNGQLHQERSYCLQRSGLLVHEGVWPRWQMRTEIQPAFPLPSCMPWRRAVPCQQKEHLFLNYAKVLQKLPVAQEIINSRSVHLHQALGSLPCSGD